MKNLPTLHYEKELWQKGFHVIGIDEVGRGSWAGPLMIGAVCLGPLTDKDCKKLEKSGIDDSKRLTATQRQKLSRFIRSKALTWSVASCSASYIDTYGLTKATHLSVRQAVKEIRKKLNGHKPYLLIDAFSVKRVRGIGMKNQKAIIKGDQISISIAAASIIAKVERDKLMRLLARKYKGYYWGKNKGYGTKKHIAAIRKNGKTELHRNLFLRKVFL